MRDLLPQLLEIAAGKRDAVYCRLVETRGSTPQKPGATMLIYADGSQAGTLGGGCVEAEVKRKALGILNSGTGDGEIALFQLDNDYGWDDGLICGGRMHILMQPVQTTAVREYLTQLTELIVQSPGFVEVIVFDQQNESEPATLILFDEQAQQIASLGVTDGTPVESISAMVSPLTDRPKAIAQDGIAILPVLEQCRLLIVGGGHIGKAVADLAYDLDFDVWVQDDRESIISEDRFPRATKRLAGSVDQVLPGLPIDKDTYCLIVTRGHNHDEEALYYLAPRGARYIGMIGSKRKIRMIFDDLRTQGISAEDLEQVHAPVGVEIGSQTVIEIAISICAELISHRNCNGTIIGRPAKIEVQR
jgi:xanthine dehydrogenase accessory factor|tara:strand:- start:2399 stop:3481 length:1083 start_codon:yes stop_codon:yes gene_type:complete